ncbi:SHOCT domain-containing protein [Thermosipho ferrireducens]|uniref:SHOCT domain-containing protein n=1 Tax=Thermosipho ferrireducens TaxID=2571116 RepID=A0ABX7S8A1_9BACT|nr:SHOCT domain-containing protein [Thermosipho ferrireducens]QTA38030.1 SHOCT domain-containing protein [Thermosipho ferrireducens]
MWWHWPGAGCGLWSWGFGNGTWWFGLLWALLWIVVIVGTILIIVKLFSKTSFSNSDNALKILKSRFARGEISEEEFVKMKKLLKN